MARPGRPGVGHGPWLTLANANNLSQGTCINIQAGTYTVNAQSVSLASGQGASLPGGYLVIWSDGSFGRGSTAVDGTIFKAPTTVDYNAMIGLGSNYIIIDGLELDGSHPDDGGNTIGLQGPGIMSFTHEHVKILNSKIHNFGASGIANSGSSAGGGDFFEWAYNGVYISSMASGFSESGINIYVPIQDDAGAMARSW